MNGGVITDADHPAINLYGECKATINDGEILAPKDDANGYAGNGITLYKNTELIINGGTITSYGSAIIGNGSGPDGGRSEGTNAKITINGGTITATNVAVIVSSVIFGLGHIFGVLGEPILVIVTKVIWTIAMGIYFGAIYKKTNNLWIPIILHFIINICALPYCFTTNTSYPMISLYIILPTYLLLGIYGMYIIKMNK